MDTYPIKSEGVVRPEVCDTEEALLACAHEAANTVEAFKNRQLDLCGLMLEWGTPHEPNTVTTVNFKATRESEAAIAEGEPEYKFGVSLSIDGEEVDALPDEAVIKACQDNIDVDFHNLRQITYDYSLFISFAKGELDWRESRVYYCMSGEENEEGEIRCTRLDVVLDYRLDGELIDDEIPEITDTKTAIDELEMMLGGVGREVESERVRIRVAQARRLIETALTRTPLSEDELQFTCPEIS